MSTAAKTNTYKKQVDRVEDLHLQLSEKYQSYKDLSERCLLNTQHIDKGDKRVFYLKPESIFLDEPRKQNQFRNDFVKFASTPPAPQPLTLFADDLHRDFLEQIQDKSSPSHTKDQLANFFRRRQYKLQHKKYKLMQRWAHHALTSELVDKVSLKFSPTYSKLQFELENSVKRYQRLEGEDHFLNTSGRPQAQEGSEILMSVKQEKQKPISSLRIDDIDVYLRVITYEEKINKDAERLIQRVKWVPLTQRFEIFQDSIYYQQDLRKANLTTQRSYLQALEAKGQHLISYKKLGPQGQKELSQILQGWPIAKWDKRSLNIRDKYLSTAKQNYELPKMIVWNEIDLKLQLAAKALPFGIHGDLEIDSGHSFAYSIMVFFPTYFQSQVIKSQFALYDAVPALIDPTSLAKKNIKKVLERNKKKYGKAVLGQNSLLEMLEIKKKEEILQTQFLNSVEKALFGEFNSGQIKDFPSVRIKSSSWIPYICFQPVLSQDQMYQAAVLAGENNPVDECLKLILELINVQDLSNVNLILESLSSIHHDKVKYGQIRSDFLLHNAFASEEDLIDKLDSEHIFTERDRSFLSLFKGCLKTKSDYDYNQHSEDIPRSSLLELPQHLLFSLYLLKYLRARDSKIKLLYTLNAFRALQKRLVIELREMGTRDRVMGDCNYLGPMENSRDRDYDLGGDDEDDAVSKTKSKQEGRKSVSRHTDTSYSAAYLPTYLQEKEVPKMQLKVSQKDKKDPGDEDIDIINDHLIDIQKIRFNGKFQNFIYSTNPLIPRYHATFGEPLDRQEISVELQNQKVSDNKKEEGKRLLGRVDTVYLDDKTSVYLVRDDFGVHILEEAALADMRSLETELLKIASYYINKQEPILDQDIRNIYPAVDRFEVLEELCECELQYQNTKAEVVLAYMECFEHMCDVLEQQRLIQIVIDLMAQRPRLNLNATHFKDSYTAETACLRAQHDLLREIIRMQMANEFQANNQIREYLERTYRLVMDQVEDKWQYVKPENLEGEIKNRENLQKGLHDESVTTGGGLGQDSVQTQDTNEASVTKKKTLLESIDPPPKPQVYSAKFSDPKEFANHLGIPFTSLQMLMKDHKERDPLIKQTIHEHVSFIKIEEGYPIFMYNMQAKQNNTLAFTKNSTRIGILDFYESLSIIVKITAAMKGANKELQDVHRPDNGLSATCLEISTYKFILAELKQVKGEKSKTLEPLVQGLNYIEDDSIVGNPDKMLYYTKEFAASAEDEQASHNPYVLTKLNLKTIDNFQFDSFQKLLEQAQASGVPLCQEDIQSRRKFPTHHAYRFFPKLKARAQKVFLPSMLFLTCNSIEVLRLRHILGNLVIQTKLLERVYEKQMKLLSKDGRIYFKDPFNFETFLQLGEAGYINFVDEGPSSGLDIDFAINEFDSSLRSHINFSDPDSFKMLICPLGLEELRATVMYELMNLQSLIVGTKTNQILLDHQMRYLSELDFFSCGYVLPNPVFDYYQKLVGANLMEHNLRKVHLNEKSVVTSHISQQIGCIYYNVIARKNRCKNSVEKLFQRARPDIIDSKDKVETNLRKLRTFKVMLCQDYVWDILSEVYQDAIKLQTLVTCDQLRKRAFLMPKESMLFELGPCDFGEFNCLNYRLEPSLEVKQKFLTKGKKHIQRFWKIPSNKEIMKWQPQVEVLKNQDLKSVYLFEKDSNQKLHPNLKKNEQSNLLKAKNQTFDLVSLKDADLIIKQKKRLVEFKGSFSFEETKLLQLLTYFNSLMNLYDLEFFQNKIGSQAETMAEAERFVMSGLPFWEEGDEAIFNSNDDDLRIQSENGTPSSSQLGYKNLLASKVMDRMAKEKRYKLTMHQELESVKDKFNELQGLMQKLELHEDISKAAEFLNEYQQLSYYGVLSSLSQMQDIYLKEQIGDKELLTINDVIEQLSHVHDQKITYQNGFHVNTALTDTSSINIDETVVAQDFDQFKRCAQPIIDENALSPSQYTLVESMYSQNSVNLRTFKKNRCYMGCMMPRDYHQLDVNLNFLNLYQYSMVNLDKQVRKYAFSYFISVDNQLKEYVKVKFGQDDKSFTQGSNSQQQFFDMVLEKKHFMKTLLRSRQLKRILLVILNNGPLPLGVKDYAQLMLKYSEDVQWKIGLKWDEIQIKRLQQNNEKQQQQQRKSEGQVAVQGMRKKEDNLSNVVQQMELAQCEIEVLSNELQLFLVQCSFKMLDQETTALAKCFEMNGKHLEYYVHPCQQFASTLNQEVDKRHHLDILNKVSFAQRFLTQIKNRCLELETLTSGIGLVISQKDLNECLEEACRSVVKEGEIQMRTRCETYAMQMVQLENLLYIKDRQLQNMEGKLKHAQVELGKIIRTKVFSKGNQLVYELDISNRQLRLLKDNVLTLESKLTDQIRLHYDRDLEQTRLELEECRRKFGDFQVNINARVMADVRDNINSIDQIMKGKAELFKDLNKITPNTNNTTININSLTIKNLGSGVQGGHETLSQGDSNYYSRIIKEFDNLKLAEKEARQEIIKLQEIIRRMRIFSHFKEVLLKQKFDHKIDNLNQQLNSNTLLWEQLAEGEKREKILKQELENSQQEIVTQEKIIEQLRDEVKRERGEKTKLIQYRQTKSKRLEELESKAREFEVLQNLNLPKILALLESKEDKITYLKSKDKLQEVQISKWQQLKETETSKLSKKLAQEVRMKSEAIAKLENMRHELQLIDGQDQSVNDMWREKCRKLIEICKSFKEENEKLQVQIVQQQDDVQSQNEGSSNKHKQSNPESGLTSTRFKLKKDFPIQTSAHQNQMNANISFDQGFAYATQNNMNKSMVLAGNVTNTDRNNQSFVVETTDKQGGAIQLPTINKRHTYMSQMRATQFTNPDLQAQQSMFTSKQITMNIFSGKQSNPAVLPSADIADGPKTPERPGQINEKESHASSAYGKLTPVYDPSKVNTQQKYRQGQSVTKASDNVFSTLSQQARPLNVSMNTSMVGGHNQQNGFQTSLDQMSQSLKFQKRQEQMQRSVEDLRIGQQIQKGQSRNMNIISQQQSVIGSVILNQTANIGVQGSNKLMGNSTLGDISARGGGSTSVVKTKVISPPRALKRDLDRSGFKGGQLVVKRSFQTQDIYDQQQ